jgi:hypothetical protein
LDNEADTWEFKREARVEVVRAVDFRKDLRPLARVLEVRPIFRPLGEQDDKEDYDFFEEPGPDPPDLVGVPDALRQRFSDVFDPRNARQMPPHRETDHAITLKPGQDPPYRRTYQLSLAEQRALDEFVSDALEKGIIRESISPAGAPILFVPKKDGTLRLCVDYRGLNDITIKNRYPLPLIGELLDRLNGAKVFSKLDLKDAYYRIRIREGDEWKTAFRTKYGHFEFLVMPMGLTNAPATFQSYINRALRGYVDDFCVVYLDDILIFSRTPEEHQHHLELVLERLRQAELYANVKKCSFFRDELEFLGFIINQDGVKMDPSRVEAIREWKNNPPQTYRDIQVFLGFCNFYRRFIFGFSRIAKPLHDLLKGMKNGRKPGRISTDWQEPQEQAYHRLIDAFTTAPVLRHYEPSRSIRLETDASEHALAGILSQSFEDGWHPIAYFSRKFSGAELLYPVYDKELMAIVMSFRHWRHYLEGAQDVEVFSDHENLKRFMSQTSLNGRQARWLLQLVPYDFRIFYRKGPLNPADAPSRRPDYCAGELEDDTPISRLLPSLQAKVAQSCEDSGRVEPIRRPRSEVELKKRSMPGLESAQRPEEGAHRWGLNSESVALRGAEAVQLLASQVVRRSEARDAFEGLDQGRPLESHSLCGLIRQAQELDPVCKQARRKLELPPGCTVTPLPPRANGVAARAEWSLMAAEPGLLCRAGLVYIPPQESVRAELLRLFHDCPSAGHWGAQKTLDLLQRHFDWDGINGDVREYVATCPQCQGKAVHRHKPYGKLEPLPIPDSVATHPFKEISLDWITGLPESRQNHSRQSFNAILTVVDRLTKYALFIPTRNDTSAADFAEAFFEKVECRFGTPHGVVSDRDSRITSDFWKEVCAYKILKRRMSTAFHPQTDGQSEALNRVVEDYLRAYTTDEPASWVNLLPLAQYAYNNSRNHTTGKSPNWFMHGFDCEIRLHIADDTPRGKIPAARDRVEKLHELRLELRDKLTEAHERMAKYYNRRHTPKQFRRGALVKLSTKNLKLKNKKIGPRWVGPFRILERIGGQAYRLALPNKYSGLHDVFPVQLLEPYHARDENSDLLPMPDLEAPQDIWEVEEVKGTARIGGKRHYLIKWAGWPAEYNSWEPQEHLAPPLVTQFEASQKRKRRRGNT